MPTTSPAIRGGPLLALLAALVAGVPANASDAPRHYYSIQGSLSPIAAPASGGDAMKLTSRLSPAAESPVVQSGGRLMLTAKLAASPMVCYGDTIFRDGFEL